MLQYFSLSAGTGVNGAHTQENHKNDGSNYDQEGYLQFYRKILKGMN
jgi:hypothetical protein